MPSLPRDDLASRSFITGNPRRALVGPDVTETIRAKDAEAAEAARARRAALDYAPPTDPASAADAVIPDTIKTRWHRDAVRLYREGRSVSQIAALLGRKPERTIWDLFRRLRAKYPDLLPSRRRNS